MKIHPIILPKINRHYLVKLGNIYVECILTGEDSCGYTFDILNGNYYSFGLLKSEWFIHTKNKFIKNVGVGSK